METNPPPPLLSRLACQPKSLPMAQAPRQIPFASKMTTQKSPSRTAFETPFEGHRLFKSLERRRRANFPRDEFRSMRLPTRIMLRQPLFQILRPAGVNLLRMRERLQNINVMKAHPCPLPFLKSLACQPKFFHIPTKAPIRFPGAQPTKALVRFNGRPARHSAGPISTAGLPATALVRFNGGPARHSAQRDGGSQLSESNRRPTVYKTVALPLS